MPLTHKVSDVVQALVNKYKTNAVSLGIAELPGSTGPGNKPSVFYGDQNLIPVVPTLCVDSGPRLRTLNHTGFTTDVDFTIYVIIYHGKHQDVQITKKECDQFAEAVETLTHQDKQLGGLVVNGFISASDPGFAPRGGVLWKATRLTWSGLSKTAL